MKKFFIFLITVLILSFAQITFAAYAIVTSFVSTGDGFSTVRILVTMGTDDDSSDTITLPEIIAGDSSGSNKTHQQITSALGGMIWWIAAKPGTDAAAPAAALEIDLYSSLPVKKVSTITGFSTTLTNKIDMGSDSANPITELQGGDYFQLNDFGSTGDTYTIDICVFTKE